MNGFRATQKRTRINFNPTLPLPIPQIKVFSLGLGIFFLVRIRTVPEKPKLLSSIPLPPSLASAVWGGEFCKARQNTEQALFLLLDSSPTKKGREKVWDSDFGHPSCPGKSLLPPLLFFPLFVYRLCAFVSVPRPPPPPPPLFPPFSRKVVFTFRAQIPFPPSADF